MEKCCGLWCPVCPCPLNMRPVEPLEIGMKRTYYCSELVQLYQKFQEIGKYIKEEKKDGL